MRLMVTGGAGYIGSHTALVLLEAGHEVVVVDNLSNSKEEALRRVRELTGRPIAFHRVDLLDADGLRLVGELAAERSGGPALPAGQLADEIPAAYRRLSGR